MNRMEVVPSLGPMEMNILAKNTHVEMNKIVMIGQQTTSSLSRFRDIFIVHGNQFLIDCNGTFVFLWISKCTEDEAILCKSILPNVKIMLFAWLYDTITLRKDPSNVSVLTQGFEEKDPFPNF